MTPVEALIWFICMTTAVFVVLAGGVFLAARSGDPHVRRARTHARLHLGLPMHHHKHAS
jgi:hypothetical protein